MSWKLLIGRIWDRIDRAFQRSGISFIKRNYPYNRNWVLDAKRILNSDINIIIDAGANIGSISKELHYWFPDATIYAFEPIKNTFNLLVKNTQGISEIHPVHSALGSEAGTTIIALNSENTINSLKVKKVENTIGTEQISITRIDEFLNERGIHQIHILKIDVEGFEFEVLAGCGDLKVDCILLEVGYTRDITKVHFSDVETWMENHGFQLCGIYEIMRNLYNKKTLSYSNNLYIRRELLFQNP